ncbi:MAG TPA: pilus assembly protein, partial [Sulfurivirga caldicuralii]|nr:pilus assembly protein [Sulfurivirga caldicuralii]
MDMLRPLTMRRQGGFSLIEAVYVLPLMLIVILALVEAVNYASDRYYLNNALTDFFYNVVMTEAQARASSPDYDSQLVRCVSGRVQVDENQAGEMLRQMVLNVTNARSDTLEIVAQKQTLMGI